MNKQITEDYCNKEISFLLMEKGFDVPVKNYFSLNKDAILHNLDKKYGAKKNWNRFEYCISRPSQSIVLKWLREVHKINIVIGVAADDDNIYSLWKFDIWNGNYSIIWGNKREKFNSYEQAVDVAIKYTLENFI